MNEKCFICNGRIISDTMVLNENKTYHIDCFLLKMKMENDPEEFNKIYQVLEAANNKLIQG